MLGGEVREGRVRSSRVSGAMPRTLAFALSELGAMEGSEQKMEVI